MSVCTFFGHRDTKEEVIQKLEKEIVNLIETENVDNFLVGNQGNFDFFVAKVLKKLQVSYPNITYTVVLSYMPQKEETENSIYPEFLVKVPYRYAIAKRNEWMIEQADYVITCVKYNVGGAYKYKSLSEKKNKIVINI